MIKSFSIFSTYLLALFASTSLIAYPGQEYDEKFVTSISKEEEREWKVWSQDVDSDTNGYIIFSPDRKYPNQDYNIYSEGLRIDFMEYLFDGVSHLEGSLMFRLFCKDLIDKRFESVPGYHFDIFESTYKDEQEGDYIIFTIQVPVPVDGDPPFWSIVKITFHDSLAKIYTYEINQENIDQDQFDTWIARIKAIR